MPFCRVCGEEVTENDRVCGFCANPLGGPQADVAESSSPAVPVQPPEQRSPLYCRYCGAELQNDPRFCSFCGVAVASWGQPAFPLPVRPAGGAAAIGGPVVTLLGCLGLAIGPFLAWATAGVFSASGLQKTGNEAIVLTVLGVIGIAISVVALALRRSVLKWALLVVGVIGLGISLFYYFALRSDLAVLDDEFLAASMGAGIWVCLVSALVVVAGAVITIVAAKERRLG